MALLDEGKYEVKELFGEAVVLRLQPGDFLAFIVKEPKLRFSDRELEEIAKKIPEGVNWIMFNADMEIIRVTKVAE